MTAVAEGNPLDQAAGSGRIIKIVGGVFVVFLAWAALAWVDEIVRAEGEVVSTSRSQIVQNLEGGILAEMHVRQGDRVNAGDVIARLQDTKYRTTVDDLQDQIDALEIKRHRLEAELQGLFDFNVPDDLAQRSPGILTSERALLAARQNDFVSRRDSARKIYETLREEYETMERLYADEIVALIEVNRAKKAASDAESKYSEIGTRAELELAESYSETLQDLTSNRQELRFARDQLNRTIITSPMDGIVNALQITTIGGVIRPGEEIMEIIPQGEELYVEARVRPEDIASVQPGQSATVKLSAYDYTIYGALQGTVTFVSADTFEDERTQRPEPYYRVSVEVDTSAFTDRQRDIEIRPGMRATVELQTGSKTILTYLLKPLYKSQEAFRER